MKLENQRQKSPYFRFLGTIKNRNQRSDEVSQIISKPYTKLICIKCIGETKIKVQDSELKYKTQL